MTESMNTRYVQKPLPHSIHRSSARIRRIDMSCRCEDRGVEIAWSHNNSSLPELTTRQGILVDSFQGLSPHPDPRLRYSTYVGINLQLPNLLSLCRRFPRTPSIGYGSRKCSKAPPDHTTCHHGGRPIRNNRNPPSAQGHNSTNFGNLRSFDTNSDYSAVSGMLHILRPSLQNVMVSYFLCSMGKRLFRAVGSTSHSDSDAVRPCDSLQVHLHTHGS